MPENFLKLTHLDFQTLVSPKQVTCFVPPGSQYKLFDLHWVIPLDGFYFLP